MHIKEALRVAAMLATAVIVTIAVAAISEAVGAQTGDHCVTFDGTRLLNQDGNDAGEVRGVFIPGGDYLIELSSVDESHPDSETQPDEVWLLVVNGDIIVGPSADIADDAVTSVATVGPVSLPNVDTLQAVHARIGDNINSVDPVSACFVSVAPQIQPLPDPVMPDELPEKPEPLEPVNEEAPQDEPVNEEAPQDEPAEEVPGEDPEQPATAPEQPDAQTLDEPEPNPDMPSRLADTGATSTTLKIALFGWALLFAGVTALGAGRRTASAA